MLVGYARVSTQEQNLDLQKDALEKAGCEKLFTEQVSGASAERPGLEQALAFVRACVKSHHACLPSLRSTSRIIATKIQASED